MSSLDEKQLLRIENFFKRQEKLYSAKREKVFCTITPTLDTRNLIKITIEIRSTKNLYGWRNYLDIYTYIIRTRKLHSEHIPDNPHKESQEKELLELIELWVRVVDQIKNNPE
ncbi:hypothetical protein IDE33_002635 [Enterococcus faecalis]|nr:hypothetical protein [Enterococcus faecalis]